MGCITTTIQGHKIDTPFFTTYIVQFTYRCHTNEINARTTMVSVIYFIRYEYNIMLEIIKRRIPEIPLYYTHVYNS